MAEADPNLRLHRLLAYVRSGEPDLTNRQMAIMLLIVLKPGPHAVRSIAARLGVGKPVITRAATTLTVLGLAERQANPDDRRCVFIVPTSEGRAFVERLPL